MACSQTKSKVREGYRNQGNELVQSRNVSGTMVTITYMPACWEQALGRKNEDIGKEMTFRVNVQLPPGTGLPRNANPNVDRVDTAFQLTAKDSDRYPVFAQRVANGNTRGVEYLVSFERRNGDTTGEIQFLFKDWIFTHNKLRFSFDTKNIKNIDAISCGL